MGLVVVAIIASVDDGMVDCIEHPIGVLGTKIIDRNCVVGLVNSARKNVVVLVIADEASKQIELEGSNVRDQAVIVNVQRNVLVTFFSNPLMAHGASFVSMVVPVTIMVIIMVDVLNYGVNDRVGILGNVQETIN